MPLRFIIILLLVAVAEYYSFVVVRSALRTMAPTGRNVVIGIYLLLSLLVWVGIFTIRSINWANVPHMLRNVYIATALGLTVGKLLILAIMLIDDLRRLVLWVITLFYTGGTAETPLPGEGAKTGITRSIFLSRLALIMGGTALAAFIYGITNRYRYQVKRVAMRFPHLPAALRGMKIVQISDVHSGSFDNPEAVLRGVEKIMAERPDLILFTGDLVNNKADEIEPYKAIFSRLHAPLGVYSTLGNHDYGDYVNDWPSPSAKVDNLARLKAAHAEMGWRLMMNEHVLLEKDGAQIALLGIENWSAKPQFPKHGDMKAAYAGLAEKNIPFKILMSHDPSHWDAQVTKDYGDIDLTLSGHTHGMQFGIEIPGFKWSPVQFMYKKWAGLYQEGAQYLYVNRGYGFLGYPGRLGILPEITVFELA